jgi:YidC/Oxa1 family membrane protein insertase
LVKLLLLPLTNKSFKSMKAMQKLKPKMDTLREKYAADKERLNQEMLNLYKTHKINPLAGCLPMVLQMPVWIALYRTIWSSVELYQASFLWLPDLSSEDPSFVLPVLLGIVTFVQQKIQPAQMDATQQKIMMWMMPVMFTGFMLFLPSALVVYIFCNSLLTIAQQWYIKRGDE